MELFFPFMVKMKLLFLVSFIVIKLYSVLLLPLHNQIMKDKQLMYDDNIISELKICAFRSFKQNSLLESKFEILNCLKTMFNRCLLSGHRTNYLKETKYMLCGRAVYTLSVEEVTKWLLTAPKGLSILTGFKKVEFPFITHQCLKVRLQLISLVRNNTLCGKVEPFTLVDVAHNASSQVVFEIIYTSKVALISDEFGFNLYFESLPKSSLPNQSLEYTFWRRIHQSNGVIQPYLSQPSYSYDDNIFFWHINIDPIFILYLDIKTTNNGFERKPYYNIHDGPGIKSPVLYSEMRRKLSLSLTSFTAFIVIHQNSFLRRQVSVSYMSSVTFVSDFPACDEEKRADGSSVVTFRSKANKNNRCRWTHRSFHTDKNYGFNIHRFNYRGNTILPENHHTHCPFGGFYVYGYASSIRLYVKLCETLHIKKGESFRFNTGFHEQVIFIFYAFKGYSEVEFMGTISLLDCLTNVLTYYKNNTELTYSLDAVATFRNVRCLTVTTTYEHFERPFRGFKILFITSRYYTGFGSILGPSTVAVSYFTHLYIGKALMKNPSPYLNITSYEMSGGKTQPKSHYLQMNEKGFYQLGFAEYIEIKEENWDPGFVPFFQLFLYRNEMCPLVILNKQLILECTDCNSIQASFVSDTDGLKPCLTKIMYDKAKTKRTKTVNVIAYGRSLGYVIMVLEKNCSLSCAEIKISLIKVGKQKERRYEWEGINFLRFKVEQESDTQHIEITQYIDSDCQPCDVVINIQALNKVSHQRSIDASTAFFTGINEIVIEKETNLTWKYFARNSSWIEASKTCNDSGMTLMQPRSRLNMEKILLKLQNFLVNSSLIFINKMVAYINNTYNFADTLEHWPGFPNITSSERSCTGSNCSHTIKYGGKLPSPTDTLNDKCSAAAFLPDNVNYIYVKIPCDFTFNAVFLCESKNISSKLSGVSSNKLIRTYTLPNITCPPGYFLVSRKCIFLKEPSLTVERNESFSCGPVETNTNTEKVRQFIASILSIMPYGTQILGLKKMTCAIALLLDDWRDLYYTWHECDDTFVDFHALKHIFMLCQQNPIKSESLRKFSPTVKKCKDGSYIASAYFCDGLIDCPDGSDEFNCISVCEQPLSFKCPGSNICIKQNALCDGTIHCPQQFDELFCVLKRNEQLIHFRNIDSFRPNKIPSIYARNNFCDEQKRYISCYSRSDKYSIGCFDYYFLCKYEVNSTGGLLHCPNGAHLANCINMTCIDSYKCEDSYCISPHYVCDGTIHCPNGDDELQCTNLKCPGMLACVDSNVCIQPWQMCDGIADCPYDDDELYCQPCPNGCSCNGNAYLCNSYSQSIQNHDMIISLTILSKEFLQRQLLRELNRMLTSFSIYPYLHLFNMSGTVLSYTNIPHLKQFPNLAHLSLANNNIKTLVFDYLVTFDKLYFLDFSSNYIKNVSKNAFKNFPNIEIIILSFNEIEYLPIDTFQTVLLLLRLDVSNNPLKFIHPDIFLSHRLFHTVKCSGPLCCCIIKEPIKCLSDVSEKHICNFLQNYSQIYFIVIYTILGVSANLFVCVLRTQSKSIDNILVTNLAISDIFVLLSCCFIILAFYLYGSSFDRIIQTWETSTFCLLAKVTSFTCTQNSMLISALLALSRAIQIKKMKRRSVKSVKFALSCIWLFSLLVAFIYGYRHAYTDYDVQSLDYKLCLLEVNPNRLDQWDLLILQILYLIINITCLVIIIASYNMILSQMQKSRNVVMKKSKHVTGMSKNLKVILNVAMLGGCYIIGSIPTITGIILTFFVSDISFYSWLVILAMPLSPNLLPLVLTIKPMMLKKKSHLTKGKGKIVLK